MAGKRSGAFHINGKLELIKKALKISLIVLAAGFLLIQFDRPGRTNPVIVQSETLEANTIVPENIRNILTRSCSDCHSNNTDWIWYSNIAPISWGMVDHVDQGRGELNFSLWGTYSKERKNKKLDEICEEVESGEMPHYQYLWLHWDSKLSIDDVKSLCEWTREEARKLNQTENSN